MKDVVTNIAKNASWYGVNVIGSSEYSPKDLKFGIFDYFYVLYKNKLPKNFK